MIRFRTRNCFFIVPDSFAGCKAGGCGHVVPSFDSVICVVLWIFELPMNWEGAIREICATLLGSFFFGMCYSGLTFSIDNSQRTAMILGYGSVQEFVVWIVAVIIGLTVHEFSHAYAAYRLGDVTPEAEGRLSLNPLKHIDWLGMLMLIFVRFGWGKPVRYNPYNLRNQKWGPAVIALAGPFSNLLLAIIFGAMLRLAVSYGLFLETGMLVSFLYTLVILNIILMAFNLIPVPPLDGSKVLFSIIPGMREETKMKLEQYGPFFLLGLLLLGGGLISTLFAFVLRIASFLIGFPLY